ncbi:MAG TPA: magnesium transporter, partial [Candidatus Hydrogenedentes bacterium]|nr:magnesium transporter [Candidatus Hydrogenedentota bacterium]
LGLVVGLAFFLNILVAVSLGGLIPLLLRRFKIDPALGAPPILTTITDMCGFMLVLGLASIALATGLL